MDQIKMDFGLATKEADRLEELASRTARLVREQFEDTMALAASAWEGEDAQAYLGKGARMAARILGTAEDMHKAAEIIRTVALKTYEAEIHAKEIAEQRSV